MPDPNSEEQVPELTEQQKYVNEKVAVLLDQIGDEYGESLTQQLVQRLDTTVADFHEEVTNLLSELKEKSVSRQQKLRDAWQHRFETPPQAAEVPATATEATPSEGEDSSDWEKRLETMESGEKGKPSDDDKKKKKKGFFGRKKK
jgi:small-conductance mechanosensitive channel